MSTVTLVKHPGAKVWAEIVKRFRAIDKNRTVDGEAHALVPPTLFNAVWHWASTELADTKKTPRPLVPPPGADSNQGGVAGGVKRERKPKDFGHKINWKDQPPPKQPFQVPVAPWIVFHRLPSAGTMAPIIRDFPRAFGMEESQYLIAYLSPYVLKMIEKGKPYNAQPPDIRLEDEPIQTIPSEIMGEINTWGIPQE